MAQIPQIEDTEKAHGAGASADSKANQETASVPVGDGPAPQHEARHDEGQADADADAYEYADGGLAAWSQVLAGHLINMLAWGYSTTWGVYQLYYTSHLSELSGLSSSSSPAQSTVSSAQVAWIGSIQVFLTFVLCAPVGRLADAGHSRVLVAAGSVLAIGGTFATSFATEYWQIFLAQGVCTGLGLGCIFMPTISVIGGYFRRKRSLALAISAAGTGTGSLVFPSVIQYLIPRVGFPWAVRCSAFVALALAAAFNSLLRPNLKPRTAGPLVEWAAFREPPYVLFVAGSFFFFWALFVGFYYINSYARNVIGFDTTTSVTLLLVTNGLGIPARPMVGYLADRRVGPINMFICTTLVLGGVFYTWIAVSSRAGMYAFAAALGLATGAAQGIFVGSLASLTHDPRKMGTRFGMACTIMALAVLSGPPTAGAIVDRMGGSYLGAQLWAGTVTVLGAATVAAARWWVTGWRLKVKV